MLHRYKDDLIVILTVDRNLFCWVSWAILLFVQWILWVVTLTMLFLYYQAMSFGTITIWEPIGKFFPARHSEFCRAEKPQRMNTSSYTTYQLRFDLSTSHYQVFYMEFDGHGGLEASLYMKQNDRAKVWYYWWT